VQLVQILQEEVWRRSLLDVFLEVLIVTGALARVGGGFSTGLRRAVAISFSRFFTVGLPRTRGVVAGRAPLACGCGHS
jgi:hypothetical protein